MNLSRLLGQRPGSLAWPGRCRKAADRRQSTRLRAVFASGTRQAGNCGRYSRKMSSAPACGLQPAIWTWCNSRTPEAEARALFSRQNSSDMDISSDDDEPARPELGVAPAPAMPRREPPPDMSAVQAANRRDQAIAAENRRRAAQVDHLNNRPVPIPMPRADEPLLARRPPPPPPRDYAPAAAPRPQVAPPPSPEPYAESGDENDYEKPIDRF